MKQIEHLLNLLGYYTIMAILFCTTVAVLAGIRDIIVGSLG